MTSMFKKQWTKLREKLYREHFVAAEVKRGIPFQMRAMLKAKGWSQEQLAGASGLTQGVISRALNPNYGNLTLNTVIRIAAGFDVAFIGKFVPFSELLRMHERLSEEDAGSVNGFETEDEVLEELMGRQTHDTSQPDSVFAAARSPKAATVQDLRNLRLAEERADKTYPRLFNAETRKQVAS